MPLSARRPLHGSLAEKMEVEMMYALASVFTCVYYHSVSVFKTQVRSYVLYLQKDVGQNFSILFLRFVQ